MYVKHNTDGYNDIFNKKKLKVIIKTQSALIIFKAMYLVIISEMIFFCKKINIVD